MGVWGHFPENRREYITPEPAMNFDFCHAAEWGFSFWFDVQIEVVLGGRLALDKIPGIISWILTGKWEMTPIEKYMTSFVDDKYEMCHVQHVHDFQKCSSLKAMS